jgi:hypothetical protein
MASTVNSHHPNFSRDEFLDAKRAQAEAEGWEFQAPIDLESLTLDERARLESLFDS